MEGKYVKINLIADNFIYPYFVVSGHDKKEEIDSFPNVFRFSIDRFLEDLSQLKNLGINKVLLFGVPDKKDEAGSEAYSGGNIIAMALKEIKKKFPSLIVMTDICLCAYTTHGHCGIVDGKKIDNKATLKALAKIAVAHAEVGADYVAPSAMVDKQVLEIRRILDREGYKNTKIMSYSAKFASNFYGPFRNAASSTPKFGDRKGYQLDFADADIALKEIADDIREGADIVMVKPALSYLDVVKEASRKFKKPLAAYNVSGEYAMIKQSAKAGLLDEKKTVLEILTGIKRAGAEHIISYHAKDVVRWLKE